MKLLHDLHLKNNARMGVFNTKVVPVSYHESEVEYKAVRENALLVDHSHMAIVAVTGEDAWALVNYMVSADVSAIRDEQGTYSLILHDDGTIYGDAYILCADERYFILSENLSSAEIVTLLENVLANAGELDIQEEPEICALDDEAWGALLLEGPYSWEILAELYGFDIIGLPYHEFMPTDDNLIVFRCGKHGEFAYLILGEQEALTALWKQLLVTGEKYLLKTGGLDYQKTVRIENSGWDASVYNDYSRNPVELQLQWAIQYDKDNFIGKSAVEAFSRNGVKRKLTGIVPVEECVNIESGNKVKVEGENVGVIIKSVFSPARQSYIALALIDTDYACADIDGFTIQTPHGDLAARTENLPFLYNFSLLVSPTEHSFIDASKARSIL